MVILLAASKSRFTTKNVTESKSARYLKIKFFHFINLSILD